MEFFGYDVSDFIECEVCRSQAVDIHHIDARGMGGSKLKDFIENLMALCRDCHVKYGDLPQWVHFLVKRHTWFMENKKTCEQRW
jgi:5-methylcytosine-specific restriction endonuclease McrA